MLDRYNQPGLSRVGFFKRQEKSKRFQSGIGRHQPLGADVVELDLHPALLADPFEVEHYAFPEFRMEHPLAELDAAGVKALLHLVLAEAAVLGGAAHLGAQPDLFQTLGGHLADKAARLVEHLAAVDAAALRITDVELLHGAGHADVTEAPFLFEAA